MSFAQLLYTSSRTGTLGSPGFQVHAVTPSLTPEAVNALVRGHARYEPPLGSPYQPTPEERAELPVALRTTVVPGLGRVVSRTVYVGQEYRGRDGEPDSGRYGNFFTHVLVAADEQSPSIGDLAPVELWDSPSWTTDERDSVDLPPLAVAEPGDLDLEAAAQAVAAAPAGAVAAALDAVVAALDGEPTTVLVVPSSTVTAAWFACLTFALPPQLAARLTFSTYERNPADHLDLHLVAAVPGTDPGGTGYQRITRVDVTEAPAEAGSLYARAAEHLLREDPGHLFDVVRRMTEPTCDLAAPALVAGGGALDVVGPKDVGLVVAYVAALPPTCWAGTADQLAELPDDSDPATLAAWDRLHAAARHAGAEREVAREVASAALGRILGAGDGGTANLTPVSPMAPVSPAVAALRQWVDGLEAAPSVDACLSVLRRGLTLGLVGVNTVVDEMVSEKLAATLDAPALESALRDAARLAPAALDGLVGAVAESVVAQSVGGLDPRVDVLAPHTVARDRLGEHARTTRSFWPTMAWQRALVVLDPEAARDALTTLLRVAGPADEESLGLLWGAAGASRPDDLALLLQAYAQERRDPPAAVRDAALAALAAAPLPTEPPVEGDLGYLLLRVPGAATAPGVTAWCAAAWPPGSHPDVLFDSWMAWAANGLADGPGSLADVPRRELWLLIVRTTARHLADPRLAPALVVLPSTTRHRLLAAVGALVATRVASEPEAVRAARDVFVRFIRVLDADDADALLTTALERFTTRQLNEVEGMIPDACLKQWRDWRERHPRPTSATRVLGSLLRRDRTTGAGDR